MNFHRFISSKKSFLTSGLLNDATDIHCHILPGVDDGVSSYKKAVQSLCWLKSYGFGRIYLTPHVMSDFSKNTYGYLSEQFDVFINRLKDEKITDIPEIKLSAEYMLDATFERWKENGLHTYAGRHVLVETSYITPPLGFTNLLENLLENSYTPILAHPERYLYMDMKDYTLLKEQGVKFQLNFTSIVGVYGLIVKEKAEQLLKEDFYDYTGSDFHHLSYHSDAIRIQKLTKSQIDQLRRLFQNNHQLW